MRKYKYEIKSFLEKNKELNTDELTEKVKSLTEIIEKLSDGTRDITDEEYETLKNQGFDVSNFAKTIDGYRYLGDTADLAREISEGIKNNFIEVE
jgi:myosin heavy subunit